MDKYSGKHLEVIRAIMQSYPEVREGRMFGYPAFFRASRMLACVYGDGVGVKLPAEDIVRLLSMPGVIPFQPHGKTRMREWVQINRNRSEDYRHDVPIFERSIRFVSEAGKGERK